MKSKIVQVETDILVIGSGVAGLSFAIKAAEYARVDVITKKEKGEGSTRMAQGGIACVFDSKDAFEKHIEDTLVAGRGICNRKAVEIMVNEAPARIMELARMGVRFDRDIRGGFDLGLEGGHSRNRIVHVQDRSGLALETVLLQKAEKSNNISFHENCIAADLILDRGKCVGAWIWNDPKKEYIRFVAKIVVLASGGLGQIYSRTTNPKVATGDGFAIAARAGAVLENMEFVQFHPTALYHPQAKGFLISEALRGAGAELVLPDGKKFMSSYHAMGSLAPRDIVSGAIATEMQKHDIPCVYLDTRSISLVVLKEKFPVILAKCHELHIEIPEELIPVAPAAHYMCGGIKTDTEGLTSLPGLFALGEVACTGVHGANRLASNSLLEGIVFAHRAVNEVKKLLKSESKKILLDEIAMTQGHTPQTSFQIREAKLKIQDIMWRYAGLTQTKNGLQIICDLLLGMKAEIEEWYGQCIPGRQIIELRNMVETALLVSTAMFNRTRVKEPEYMERE